MQTHLIGDRGLKGQETIVLRRGKATKPYLWFHTFVIHISSVLASFTPENVII